MTWGSERARTPAFPCPYPTPPWRHGNTANRRYPSPHAPKRRLQRKRTSGTASAYKHQSGVHMHTLAGWEYTRMPTGMRDIVDDFDMQ